MADKEQLTAVESASESSNDSDKKEEAPSSQQTQDGVKPGNEHVEKAKEIIRQTAEKARILLYQGVDLAKLQWEDKSKKAALFVSNMPEHWTKLKELGKRFTHFDSDFIRTSRRFCLRNPALLFIFAIVSFVILYRTVTYNILPTGVLDNVELVETFHPYSFNKYSSTSLDNTTSSKKVILFSYTRAGASILGHMFNLNPDAAYWYEPLHSFYTHLYGNKVFSIANDITHAENTKRRKMSDEERNRAKSYILDLLSCRFENIPVETFSIENVVERKIEWMQSYRECMLGKVSNPTVRHCMKPLEKYCGSMTTHCIKERCDYFNELARQAQTTDQKDRVLKEVEKKDYEKLNAFIDKESCMEDLVHAQAVCLPDLHERCTQAKINVLKIYRTGPDVLDRVMLADPDVFLVHYFRDPRAIILSRQNSDTLSAISGKKDTSEPASKHMMREARMLCGQLIEDILALGLLKKKYPERIAVFRYEDYVTDANTTMSYLYSRLGEPFPDDVAVRIQTLMHSSRQEDGPFGYSRNNALRTANKWRQDMDPDVKSFIDEECVGVLKALKYDI